MSNKQHLRPIGGAPNTASDPLFFQEHVSDLTGQNAAIIWERLRRSDTQVSMLLNAIKKPIVGATVVFEAASDSKQDIFIKEFVEHVYNDIGIGNHKRPFKKIISENLTFVDFGFYLGEKIFKNVLGHPKFGNYQGLKDIAFRPQRSIWRWNVDENAILLSVEQLLKKGQVTIPGKDLLHLANGQEGANFEGVSVLRPSYGNWLRVQEYYKALVIGIERTSVGIPTLQGDFKSQGSTTDFTTDPNFLAAKTALENISTARSNSLIFPNDGYEISQLKIEHATSDILAAIQLEYTQMSKSVLLNILELAMGGGSGSYALGTDLSDIALSVPQSFADLTADGYQGTTDQIVQMKFGRGVPSPKMKFVGINDKAGTELAGILKTLQETGVLVIDNNLKEFVAAAYGLPNPDLENDTGEQEVVAEIDNADTQLPTDSDIQLAANTARGLNTFINTSTKQLNALMTEQLTQRTALYIDKLLAASNAGKSTRDVVIPGGAAYRKDVKEFLLDVGSEAADAALVGSGLTQDDLQKKVQLSDDRSSNKRIKQDADLMVDGQEAKLTEALTLTLSRETVTVDSEALVKEKMINAGETVITGTAVRTAAGNTVSSVVNNSRNSIFLDPTVEPLIESFIFSNPSPEAKICVELAGRVFTKAEFLSSNKLPPLHHNCDSTLIAQYVKQTPTKPLSPNGLEFTGTEAEVAAIRKSQTFK